MAQILLVDDDDDLRDLLEDALEGAGHRVTTSSEGTEALSLAANVRPDMIISDIIMEGMEGIAAIMAFKKLYADVPIIAISGNEFYLKQGRKLGADASLLKPFTGGHLINTVHGLLDPV